MNIVGCIPARMAATRFPGKPMALLQGVPMIGHVFLRARMSPLLSDLYVATCDQLIADYVSSIPGKAVMTSDHHEGCIDRCAEALLTIEKQTGKRVDILVVIQGDEPLIHPEMIDEAVQPLVDDPTVGVSNLCSPLLSVEEEADPNQIKVVMDQKGNALYFSREPIPSRRKKSSRQPSWKQVCIIPFKRDLLLRFSTLARTPLEIAESIDMLRLLEQGLPVRMVPTTHQTHSVDTCQDLEQVAQLMKKDPLISQYLAEAL